MKEKCKHCDGKGFKIVNPCEVCQGGSAIYTVNKDGKVSFSDCHDTCERYKLHMESIISDTLNI